MRCLCGWGCAAPGPPCWRYWAAGWPAWGWPCCLNAGSRRRCLGGALAEKKARPDTAAEPATGTKGRTSRMGYAIDRPGAHLENLEPNQALAPVQHALEAI